jgi:uncharacterized protein
MKPDHEAAKKWAEADRDNYAPDTQIGNLARAYLDAMAQLDKATELLRTASEWADSVNPAAQLAVDIRAFLDERK